MRYIVLLCVVCFAGCAASPPKPDTLAFVQDEFGRYEQAIENPAYVELVAKCMDRDGDAMQAFLSLEEQYRYDGAASEGHAAVLGFLLRHTGDEFFGASLSRCSRHDRDYVRDFLAFDMGDLSENVRYGHDDNGWLRYQYPITFAEN